MFELGSLRFLLAIFEFVIFIMTDWLELCSWFFGSHFELEFYISEFGLQNSMYRSPRYKLLYF